MLQLHKLALLCLTILCDGKRQHTSAESWHNTVQDTGHGQQHMRISLLLLEKRFQSKHLDLQVCHIGGTSSSCLCLRSSAAI